MNSLLDNLLIHLNNSGCSSTEEEIRFAVSELSERFDKFFTASGKNSFIQSYEKWAKTQDNSITLKCGWKFSMHKQMAYMYCCSPN